MDFFSFSRFLCLCVCVEKWNRIKFTQKYRQFKAKAKVKALSSRFYLNAKPTEFDRNNDNQKATDKIANMKQRKKCTPFTHDKRLCQKDKWKWYQNKNIDKNARHPNHPKYTGHHRVSNCTATALIHSHKECETSAIVRTHRHWLTHTHSERERNRKKYPN